MAQDKIIRISADITPIKEIRREVQGLTGDIDSLNRNPIGPRISDKIDLSALVSQETRPIVPGQNINIGGLRQQEEPFIPRIPDFPMISSQEDREADMEEAEGIKRVEAPQEPSTQQEEIEEPVKKKRRRPRKEESIEQGEEPRVQRRTAKEGGDQSSLLGQILKAINDGNDLLTEGTLHLENISTSLPKDEDGYSSIERKTAESGGSNLQQATLNLILKANLDQIKILERTRSEEPGRRGSRLTDEERQQREAEKNQKEFEKTLEKTRKQEEKDAKKAERELERIEAKKERDEQNRRESTEKASESRRDRAINNVTGIPGQLVRGALQAGSATINSRNTFEAGAQEVGAIGNTVGALVGTLGRSVGAMIPGIAGTLTTTFGELAGATISGISSIVSSYASRAVARAEELEMNVRPYAQITGVSSREAKSTALQEGAYAARDLGYNAGEYLNRVAGLRRAAGGKILGATEEDPTGRNEYQSQLAAQRLYGLDQGTLNQLQSSMRFSREGEYQSGGSTSPSGVIRLFENTMRELKLPFSEIAATMDESLATFNKTASNILDKAGDFDAGKVASVLASVRAYTGMEGRQLERVQTAVTGGSISQDAVTQALLMRVGREIFPEANTLSALMEKIDRIQEEPEYQKAFLKRLDDMTDNDEQLTQLMKAVYTNLSFGDIREFLKSSRGQKDFDKLFDTPVAPETAKGNEKDAQYDKSAARRTVGVIEGATAEKTNRDAANGEKMLGVLASIDSKVVQLATDTGIMETTTKSINEALDVLVKLFTNEDPKDKQYGSKYNLYQREANGEFRPFGAADGTLLMGLLRKLGLD